MHKTPSAATIAFVPAQRRSNDETPQRLLKVTEVAARLGVSRDWVYRRINRGELPVVELGDTSRNQRIRESDLAAFIEQRTYGARSPRA